MALGSKPPRIHTQIGMGSTYHGTQYNDEYDDSVSHNVFLHNHKITVFSAFQYLNYTINR